MPVVNRITLEEYRAMIAKGSARRTTRRTPSTKKKVVCRDEFPPEILLEYGTMTDPIREYPFEPGRRWRLDYAWPEARLAVEVEGGQYARPVYCNHCGKLVQRRGKDGRMHSVRAGGRHNSSGYAGDQEKYNVLAARGWRLLRYPPGKVDYRQVQSVLFSAVDQML